MNLPFFYIDTLTKESETYILSEETSKHIIQVLRMEMGERLQLTDGKGNLMVAEIIDDHKKRCAVKCINFLFVPYKTKEVSIAISLLKNASRFEWFLEKATEIGVRHIHLIQCERTEKQHCRYERMNTILISAMLQSKQVWLPQLHPVVTLQKFLNDCTSENKYIAHCEEDAEKNEIIPSRQSSLILIGPEGDFSADEIAAAKNKNFKPVSLGENRLRTETAGIVAVTLLNR